MDDFIVFLDEGEKSIATHADVNVLRRRIAKEKGGVSKLRSPGHRKTKMDSGKRLDKLQRDYRKELDKYLQSFQQGRSYSFTEKFLRSIMRRYFSKAFAEGVRVQAGSQAKVTSIEAAFTEADKRHIETAVEEEMKFMRGFLTALRNGTMKMPYDQRLTMYSRGLLGVYGGARVALLPDNVLIWWDGPTDKRKCASCNYLVAHSPFTKHNLPTTPRAGDTRCLTNCRDRLTVKRTYKDKAEREATENPRDVHVKALEKIRTDKVFRQMWRDRKVKPRYT